MSIVNSLDTSGSIKKLGVCGSCGQKVAFLPDRENGFTPVLWDSLPSVDKRNYSEGLPPSFSEKRGHVTHFCISSIENGPDKSGENENAQINHSITE